MARKVGSATVLTFPAHTAKDEATGSLPSLEDTLTIYGVMELLHVRKTKLYEMFATGELRSFKVGRERLVTRAELSRFIATRERAGFKPRPRRKASK